jgi:hypothetical protein
MDGKALADAALGSVSSSDEMGSGESELPDDDESAEDTAIAATADLLISALETKDRAGVVDALRALVTMIRDGG